LRFLYYFFEGQASRHLASLLMVGVLMIVGFQVLLIGLLADMISGNRKLVEDLLYRIRRLELTRQGEAEEADPPAVLSAKAGRER
jgi:hypothetical protein